MKTTTGEAASPVMIWTGPASAQHVRDSVPSGVRLVNVTCTGDHPDRPCAAIVNAWGDKLAELRRLAKRAPAEPLDATMAAFSAGGQIVKRVLLDAKARAELGGVLLADAMYETEWIEKPRGDDPGVGRHVEGFVLFALDAAKDGRPMLATVSANMNTTPRMQQAGIGPYPSGSAVMAGTVRELERRGATVEDAIDDPTWLQLEHPPVRAWRVGRSVLFGDFGSRYKHGEHPTIVAAAWPQFFAARRGGAPRVEPASPVETTTMPDASQPTSAPSAWGAFLSFVRSLIASLGALLPGPRQLAAPEQHAPAAPVPDAWKRYAGARPEILGAPVRTILAVPGLVKQPPAVRAKLLEVAEHLQIPVDTLAIVIQSESGWDPTAPRDKVGLPRGGLVQLTQGAHLPGFASAEDVWAVREMPAVEQLERIVLPLWQQVPEDRRGVALTPGRGYMRNFLPADADRPGEFILGDAREEPPTKEEDDSQEARQKRWRWSVYAHNPGFDRRPGPARPALTKGANRGKPHPADGKSGIVTVDDVMETAARTAAKAKGQRITVDGSLFAPSENEPAASAAVVARTGPPTGPTTDRAAIAKAAAEAEANWTPQAQQALEACLKRPGPDSGDLVRCSEDPAVLAATKRPAAEPKSPKPADEPRQLEERASEPADGPGPDPQTSSRGVLLAAVEAGTFEPVTWVQIPWQGLLVSVGRDALRASVGGRLLRLPASYQEQIAIARRLGWVLPTPDLSDAIYAAASVRLQPAPQGRWPTGKEPAAEQQRIVQEISKKQGQMAFVLAMNADVDAQIERANAAPTALVADPGKDWVLFPRASGAQNYGWHIAPIEHPTERYTSKKLKQPLGPPERGAPHGPDHSDYSQLVRPIQRTAKRASDGAAVDLLDFFESHPIEIGAPAKLTAPLRA